MKNIYDNREGLLNEKIAPNAFDNKGLRLRSKISRVKKQFEDRLCSVLLNFSSRINVPKKTAKLLAEDRITVLFTSTATRSDFLVNLGDP